MVRWTIALGVSLLIGCTMAQKRYDINESVYGLCTDPNRTKAPEGSLMVCDNVRIQREGVIEPINGAESESVNVGISNIQRMVNYDGDLLLVDADNYVCFYGSQATAIQDYDSEDFEFFNEHLRFVEINSNLYFPTSKGIQKITGSSDSAAERTGVLPHVWLSAGYSIVFGYYENDDWFTSGNCCAYKVTVTREDANSNIMESAPTEASYVNAYDLNDSYVIGIVYLGNTIQAADKIRLYRTIQTTQTAGPSNAYYLLMEIEITDAHITSGSVSFVDIVSDTDLGASLYTDSSQYGHDQRNEVPPNAKEVAVFNGHMFYSNYKLPDRIIFNMLSHNEDVSGDNKLPGRRAATGDFASGSSDITNVSDTTGFETSQLLEGTHIPAETYISGINGTTVSMSNAATGTEATAAFDVLDVIVINHSGGYEAYAPCQGQGDKYTAAGLKRAMVRASDTDFMITITGPTRPGVGGAPPTDSNFVEIRAINDVPNYTYSGFQIHATHGSAFSPELPLPSEDPIIISTEQEFVGHTMMSRYELYEAVPEANSFVVGDGKEILRTIPLGETLIFLTKSGIYIGYGAGSSFTIRQHPTPNYILVRPDAAKQVGDVIFAITDKGFVKVTSTAVAGISDYMIHHDIKGMINALMSDDTSTRGCWVEYSQKYREVYFGLPDSVGDDYVGTVYIYNTITQVFYTLTPEQNVYYMIENTSDDLLLYYWGKLWSNTASMWIENSTPGGQNASIETISVVNTSTNQIRMVGHSASVGDVVYRSSDVSAVVTYLYPSDYVEIDDASDFTTGNAQVIEAFWATVIWLPKYGPTKMLRKHFVAHSWIFERLQESGDLYTLDEIEYTLDGAGRDYGPVAIRDTTHRMIIPIAHKRKLFLTPGISINRPGIHWQLVGMGIEYDVQGPMGVKNAQT